MAEKKRIDINIERRKRIIKRRRYVTLAAALLIVASLVAVFATGAFEKFLAAIGLKGETYVEAEGYIIDYAPKGEFVCAALPDTIVVIDENGVTGLDKEGKWKWNVFYEFKNPVIETYTDIALLTDVGGTSVYCFNKAGLLWHMQFDKGVVASYYNESTGHVSVVHKEAEYRSCVTVYDTKNDNKPLFTRKFGAYYMTNADISADSSQMVVSGFYSEAGMSTSVLSFLRMRDGEVYTTEIFDDKIYPYVAYLENNALFAASSDEIVRIVRETTASSVKDSIKTVWDRNANNIAIVCLKAYKDKYLIAVFSDANTNLVSDSTVSVVRIFENSGGVKKEFQVDGKVKGINTGKDSITVYTDNRVSMYSLNGILISDYEAVSNIKSVSYIGKRVLFVSGDTKMAVADMSGD